jgi:putative transcriptional regulator
MEREKELQKLGERIKQLRIDKGLTQFELGSRINKDDSTVARIEAGRTNPTYTSLLLIAEGLEVNLFEIIEGL